MPCSASGVWGVDARFESVVLVRMGVRWMCGLMRVWASSTYARVRGRSCSFELFVGTSFAIVNVVAGDAYVRETW